MTRHKHSRWTTEEQREKAAMLSARDREADAAYEAEMGPARLRLDNPNRVPYPDTVQKALAAYDKVIAKWRPRLFS